MEIAEWKEQLRAQLKGLEAWEAEEVLGYYEEMISDRVENGEPLEAVLASYGNSRELAAAITEEMDVAGAQNEKSSGYTEKIADAVPRRIDVSVNNNRVYLLPSQDGRVHLRYRETQLTRYDYGEQGGSVTFRTKRRNLLQHIGAFFTFADIRDRKPVYLMIPAQFSGDLSVKVDNGSILAENVARAENVGLDADNGRIVFTGCRAAGSVDIHSDNGRITLRDTGAGGSVTVHATNGRVEADRVSCSALAVKSSNGALFLSRIACPDIRAKTSNGRIELGVYGNKEDYRMELKTSNGAITVQGVKLMSQTLNEGGRYSLAARSSNGRVTVNFLNTEHSGRTE